MEGWVDLGGWLHTEMVYLLACTAVTHPCTNPAWCRATSLIERNALLLRHATNPRYLSVRLSVCRTLYQGAFVHRHACWSEYPNTVCIAYTTRVCMHFNGGRSHWYEYGLTVNFTRTSSLCAGRVFLSKSYEVTKQHNLDLFNLFRPWRIFDVRTYVIVKLLFQFDLIGGLIDWFVSQVVWVYQLRARPKLRSSAKTIRTVRRRSPMFLHYLGNTR